MFVFFVCYIIMYVVCLAYYMLCAHRTFVGNLIFYFFSNDDYNNDDYSNGNRPTNNNNNDNDDDNFSA